MYRKFLQHASKESGRSHFSLLVDSLVASLEFNVSPLEYFQFRFYMLNNEIRRTYAGTGFMYEYQLKMNPPNARNVLSDKIKFLLKYQEYVKHDFVTLEDLENDLIGLNLGSMNKSGKVVLKDSNGQCGKGIVVLEENKVDKDFLVRKLKESGNNFAEEFIVQHSSLMNLSPSGLNTVRIITQLDKNKDVIMLAARLRITVNSKVDNLAAGNIAAPINLQTGEVIGPAVYSDITKEDVNIHPVTGMKIDGFQIPFWDETIDMVRRAALVDVGNKSIGWDVAITENGPELVEGNHDWCKLLWQLPVKAGLKFQLVPFLDEQ